MSGVHCYTSASFSYLNRARVLAESVKRFHPDWTMWLCLSDREPPGFGSDQTVFLFDHVVRLEELDIGGLAGWTFSHNVVELCTAVKGPMLCKILESGADKVVYLDPDIALFGPLDEISRLLDKNSIVLTPHLIAPERTSQGILDNEIGSLKHGIYNLGFIAVANTEEGRACATWWSERLQSHCFDDIPNGLFTDQRWCDLIPAFFPRTAILRDPGYNVACWNLANRPISFTHRGEILAGPVPLRFFHFTKVDTVGEAVLELYSHGRAEVFELLHWYRGRVKTHSSPKIPAGWWAYGTFEDKTPISQAQRTTYRLRGDLQIEFPDPFASGSHTFQTWWAAQHG